MTRREHSRLILITVHHQPTQAHPLQHTMSSFLNSLRPGLRMAKTATQTARAFSSSPAHALARLTVTGRLGADPELQVTASGQEVIKYVVGSSHGPRDNRQTSWFRISSFAPEGSHRDYLLSITKG